MFSLTPYSLAISDFGIFDGLEEQPVKNTNINGMNFKLFFI